MGTYELYDTHTAHLHKLLLHSFFRSFLAGNRLLWKSTCGGVLSWCEQESLNLNEILLSISLSYRAGVAVGSERATVECHFIKTPVLELFARQHPKYYYESHKRGWKTCLTYPHCLICGSLRKSLKKKS